MRHPSRDRLFWKNNRLFSGKKDTGYKVYQFSVIEDTWKIQFPDRDISEDFYNLTRAKDNCVKVYMKNTGEDLNYDMEERPLGASVDAFKV